MNDGFEPSKWPFSDFYFVACFQYRLKGFDFFVAHFSTEKVDELRRNRGVMLSKVNDGGDSVGVGNGTTLLLEVESGEDVAGEHGLIKEHFASLGRFVVANPGAKRLDVLKLMHMSRCNVFAFYLRAEGEPGTTVWKMVGGELGRNHGNERQAGGVRWCDIR